jgi:hypothetical protein
MEVELEADMSNEVGREDRGRRFEIISGITLAFFAAILAVSDLGGGKFGDDEIIGTNAKANIYAWYQSKSVKQSLVEAQRDLIRVLLDSGSIQPAQTAALNDSLSKLDEEIARYKKEKKELLLGSAAVGKENWIQDVDGELGKVVGAKEWEDQLDTLGRAGDRFDLSVLFLQLSMVLGAISLVLQNERIKWSFYGLMVATGVVGSVFTVRAYLIALSVG